MAKENEMTQKIKQVELNRKRYRELKKLDHQQMQGFITNIYIEGYKEGLKSSASVRPEDIYKILIGTKGIGETKAKAAMEQITKLFEVFDAKG